MAKLLISIAAAIILAVIPEIIIGKKYPERKTQHFKVRRMAIAAMLAAIAILLNLFGFPLWFVPGFYKLDFSELPVIIGAFAMGPVTGVIIEAVKILLNVLINGTQTAFVGETANFVMGCAFVIPASVIYYCRKTKKNACIGLVAGTVCVVIAGSLLNAFVLLPAYAMAFMKTESLDGLIGMGTDKNSLIHDLKTFVIFAVAPFNLIKFAAVSAITIFIYKPLSRLFKLNR